MGHLFVVRLPNDDYYTKIPDFVTGFYEN